MNTLSRITNIVRSNVNELLDQLEDPEKMVRQMVRDLEVDVDRVTGAVGTAVAGVRRLQKELEENRRRSEALQRRAAQAVEADDEELARQILSRRVLLDRSTDEVEAALTEGQATVERLKEQLARLREDLSDARNRQASLIARIRARREAPAEPAATDAAADMQQLERRLAHNRSEFERLRQRLDLSDLASDASAEVRSALDADGMLNRRFDNLDVRQKVDEELASLRGAKGGA